MITRAILLAACVLSFPAASFGQDYVTKQELDSAVERLSSQIAALGAAKAHQTPSLEARIADLEYNQAEMQQNIGDQGAAIGQIAKQSNGRYHWRFDANSQPAIDEFKNAIRAAVPSTGTLFVKNDTGSEQLILINGKQERILPGGEEDFPVPVGMTVTRISGEAPKSWYVGMPSYEHRITIRNRPYAPIVTRVYEYPVNMGWVAAY